jgi:hypothetical protein
MGKKRADLPGEVEIIHAWNNADKLQQGANAKPGKDGNKTGCQKQKQSCPDIAAELKESFGQDKNRRDADGR